MWIFGGVLGALIGGLKTETWQGAVEGGLWGLGIAVVLYILVIFLVASKG